MRAVNEKMSSGREVVKKLQNRTLNKENNAELH